MHRSGRMGAAASDRAEARRRREVELLRDRGFRWGDQASLAREVGVSEATVSRDLQLLRADGVKGLRRSRGQVKVLEPSPSPNR
jgi:DeoR/GlpR family transcriptional regulator of sugar metabolism